MIELNKDFNLDEIKELLSTSGDTKISLVINDNNKKAFYNLQNTRKFNLTHLKAFKSQGICRKNNILSIDFLF